MYDLVVESQRQIGKCQIQINKHGVMTIIDGASLLLGILNAINRR